MGRACWCSMRRGHQCDQCDKHKHSTCGAMHAHWSKTARQTAKKRQKERILGCFHIEQGNGELLVGLEVYALVDALNPALAVLLETTQNLSMCTNSQTATQPYLGISSNLDSGDMLPMRSSRRNEFGLTHWQAVACTAQCINLCQQETQPHSQQHMPWRWTS